MKILEEQLDAFLIEPSRYKDKRGWFEIPFSLHDIETLGLKWNKVYQINHSFTEYKGTIRGLNYQEKPYNQAKIIRCISGGLYSVGVDIDISSINYGKYVGFELTEENQYLMYLPNTYAHGFVSLSNKTELEYITDNEYNFDSSKSISWDGLGIDWSLNGKLNLRMDLLSDKNKTAPRLDLL